MTTMVRPCAASRIVATSRAVMSPFAAGIFVLLVGGLALVESLLALSVYPFA
jgi:hypothetical protein